MAQRHCRVRALLTLLVLAGCYQSHETEPRGEAECGPGVTLPDEIVGRFLVSRAGATCGDAPWRLDVDRNGDALLGDGFVTDAPSSRLLCVSGEHAPYEVHDEAQPGVTLFIEPLADVARGFRIDGLLFDHLSEHDAVIFEAPPRPRFDAPSERYCETFASSEVTAAGETARVDRATDWTHRDGDYEPLLVALLGAERGYLVEERGPGGFAWEGREALVEWTGDEGTVTYLGTFGDCPATIERVSSEELHYVTDFDYRAWRGSSLVMHRVHREANLRSDACPIR